MTIASTTYVDGKMKNGDNSIEVTSTDGVIIKGTTILKDVVGNEILLNSTSDATEPTNLGISTRKLSGEVYTVNGIPLYFYPVVQFKEYPEMNIGTISNPPSKDENLVSKKYVDGKMKNGDNSIEVTSADGVVLSGTTTLKDIAVIGTIENVNYCQLRIYPRKDMTDPFDSKVTYHGIKIQTKNNAGQWDNDNNAVSFGGPVVVSKTLKVDGNLKTKLITVVNDSGQELLINSGSNTTDSFKISSRLAPVGDADGVLNVLPIEFYSIIWPKRGIFMNDSLISGLKSPVDDADAATKKYVVDNFEQTKKDMDEKIKDLANLIRLQMQVTNIGVQEKFKQMEEKLGNLLEIQNEKMNVD